ncbi:MAG: hypothetical protein OXN25_07515 [Candidatus Poribacteria bacterium]|nr:hypothetical protein [Candidatus Poribacteria bacterium]
MGYRLNRHHKFEQDDCKYVADLETNDIIEINDVEWDILSRYETQTEYQIVEGLKEKYKVASVFEGITRLKSLGKRGQLLTQIPESAGELDTFQPISSELKLLVPFGFRRDEASIDYITNLNRYQLLSSLAQSAKLETLAFSQVTDGGVLPDEGKNFGKIRIREIKNEAGDTLAPAWYARDGYDGILLLSQFLTDDLLYYQVPDIPILHFLL